MLRPRTRVSHSDGMTPWHRMQRSWPLTRTLDEVDDTLDSPRIISLFPKTTHYGFGIQVQLAKVKQGTYHTKRATLVTFRVSLNPTRAFPEACIEIRIIDRHRRRFKKESAPQSFVGAYGPAHIQEAVPGDEEAIPATVQMSPLSRGALAIVRARVPEVQVIPNVFDMGIIVVHEQDVQLKLLPSTIDCQRAKALRRTKIHPINLPMDGDSGSSLVTCALEGGGGCHPTCDSFDAAHMTPEVWKMLLGKRNAGVYDGETVEDWVHYV